MDHHHHVLFIAHRRLRGAHLTAAVHNHHWPFLCLLICVPTLSSEKILNSVGRGIPNVVLLRGCFKTLKVAFDNQKEL